MEWNRVKRVPSEPYQGKTPREKLGWGEKPENKTIMLLFSSVLRFRKSYWSLFSWTLNWEEKGKEISLHNQERTELQIWKLELTIGSICNWSTCVFLPDFCLPHSSLWSMAILTSTDGAVMPRYLPFRAQSDSHTLISMSFQVIPFFHKAGIQQQ
jgi:hypothetical protein